ncbi:MAG: aminoacyl-histidine dipeptidase [Bacteroidaceae bacterium]|nr:aminoacyl-histidine dipeptidase [Bacteroidaceae bacterium]
MSTPKLKPARLFEIFEEICQVPRPSKHEEKISAFLADYGRRHGLETKVDAVGNVAISAPATPGMENRKAIILQAHMDMVCEANRGVKHDFMTDPIETCVDGEWLRAKGTTLGADDGIGVAAALAVLTDKKLRHGPVQAVFTVDEETGLTGAEAMKSGFMEGDILLNLDSEDEGEMFIGCAGGCRTDARFRFDWTKVPDKCFFFTLTVDKLMGGHSGDDINKGHANANKVLNRLLCRLDEKFGIALCHIEGGNKHNAIPREACAVCAIDKKFKEALSAEVNIFAAEVQAEFAAVEQTVNITLASAKAQEQCIDADTAHRFLLACYAVFNGVFAMNFDVPGLVETSSNLASIRIEEGESPYQGVIHIVLSQRSSTMSGRHDVTHAVCACFRLAGADTETGEGYPGWKPNADSEILKVAVKTYVDLFGKEPKVKAIHAGLECGLFVEKYPGLDMISFGPTLRGVHSPDERLLIPTADLFWRHLVAILENAPEK